MKYLVNYFNVIIVRACRNRYVVLLSALFKKNRIIFIVMQVYAVIRFNQSINQSINIRIFDLLI